MRRYEVGPAVKRREDRGESQNGQVRHDDTVLATAAQLGRHRDSVCRIPGLIQGSDLRIAALIAMRTEHRFETNGFAIIRCSLTGRFCAAIICQGIRRSRSLEGAHGRASELRDVRNDVCDDAPVAVQEEVQDEMRSSHTRVFF